MQERFCLLNSLLSLELPIKKTIASLEKYGADETDDGIPLGTLTREDVISALKRFLKGEVSAIDLCQWAKALELREDINFGTPEDNSTIFHVISEISTEHALLGPTTPQRAHRLLQLL